MKLSLLDVRVWLVAAVLALTASLAIVSAEKRAATTTADATSAELERTRADLEKRDADYAQADARARAAEREALVQVLHQRLALREVERAQRRGDVGRARGVQRLEQERERDTLRLLGVVPARRVVEDRGEGAGGVVAAG